MDSPTFVRSFAFATGPAYGLLLDQADPAWRRTLGSAERFDQLLRRALQLPAPAWGVLDVRGGALLDQERRVESCPRWASDPARGRETDGD